MSKASKVTTHVLQDMVGERQEKTQDCIKTLIISANILIKYITFVEIENNIITKPKLSWETLHTFTNTSTNEINC